MRATGRRGGLYGEEGRALTGNKWEGGQIEDKEIVMGCPAERRRRPGEHGCSDDRKNSGNSSPEKSQ